MSEKTSCDVFRRQVNEKIKELGAQISADMKGEPVKSHLYFKRRKLFGV